MYLLSIELNIIIALHQPCGDVGADNIISRKHYIEEQSLVFLSISFKVKLTFRSFVVEKSKVILMIVPVIYVGSLLIDEKQEGTEYGIAEETTKN